MKKYVLSVLVVLMSTAAFAGTNSAVIDKSEMLGLLLKAAPTLTVNYGPKGKSLSQILNPVEQHLASMFGMDKDSRETSLKQIDVVCSEERAKGLFDCSLIIEHKSNIQEAIYFNVVDNNGVKSISGKSVEFDAGY